MTSPQCIEAPHAPCSGRSLQTCRRGAVSVEYLMVVAVVGMTLALTLVAIGPGMLQSWSFARQVLYGRAP
jgi:hypothetical protein